MIELINLSGGYRGKKVFGPINLAIQPGETVAILGGNGSGKTTLIKTLLGLRAPLGGQVCWDGRDLTQIPLAERARWVAFVPQNHKVTFGLRVLDIVAMGGQAGLIRAHTAEAEHRAHTALAELKQTHLASKRITELSGGQQQLVLIARALAQHTPVLVLDEPVNHLDWGHQKRLLGLLANLADQQRTIIFSTHHPDQARQLAQRCLLMRAGNIITDANCAACLTAPQLHDLYDIDF